MKSMLMIESVSEGPSEQTCFPFMNALKSLTDPFFEFFFSFSSLLCLAFFGFSISKDILLQALLSGTQEYPTAISQFC